MDMNKTVKDLKGETEAIKKKTNQGNSGMENLGERTGTADSNITKKNT